MQIMFPDTQSFTDAEKFLLAGRIIFLSPRQFARIVGNWVAHVADTLLQNSTEGGCGGVSENDSRGEIRIIWL